MKAEERHKLKTNELASTLAELPEAIKKNWSSIVGVVMLILAVFIGVNWWFKSRAAAQRQSAADLQHALIEMDMAQQAAAAQAQDTGKAGTDKNGTNEDPYDLTKPVGTLARLADSGSKAVKGSALLAEADAVRSQLLFSNQNVEPARADALCGRAEKLYQKVLNQYGKIGMLAGGAQLGLGLVAEERNQRDKATEIYNKMVADSGGVLAGTVWPAQAQQRLVF